LIHGLALAATYCNILQHSTTHPDPTATLCNTLQHTLNLLQHSTTLCNKLWNHCNTSVFFNERTQGCTHDVCRVCVNSRHSSRCNGRWNTQMKHTAPHCTTLHNTTTHCTTLQHTATHCNILQRTITLCNTPQHTRNPLQHTRALHIRANSRPRPGRNGGGSHAIH